jgi:hypothetical protein
LRLLRVAMEHKDIEVRNVAIRICRTWKQPDSARIVTPYLINLFVAARRNQRNDIGMALFSLCTENDRADIGDFVRSRLSDRFFTSLTVGFICNYADKRNIERLRPIALYLMDILSEDPVLSELRTSLTLKYLPINELASFYRSLINSDVLHADLFAYIITYLGRNVTQLTEEQWHSLQHELAQSNDPHLRRIALEILISRINRLKVENSSVNDEMRVFRADPSPLVASKAQFTFIKALDEPDEEDIQDEDDWDDDDEWGGDWNDDDEWDDESE